MAYKNDYKEFESVLFYYNISVGEVSTELLKTIPHLVQTFDGSNLDNFKDQILKLNKLSTALSKIKRVKIPST